jgi:dihydrofolate reductase
MTIPAPFGEEGFQHPQLKFAVCYSGFRAPGARYRAFYEEPAIQTPVLHVLGSLDAVVEEARSRALIEACAGEPEKDGLVVWHPGGHFLPSQRPYLDATVRFIREQMERSNGSNDKGKEVEEDVNDMDLPF